MRIPAVILPIALILSACAPATAAPATASPQPPTAPPADESTAVPTAAPEPTLNPNEPPPFLADREFSTDFSKHTVPYSEVLSGGPPKGGIGEEGGIPAIADPTFVSVASADAWLEDVEPVIFVQVGDDARAYPIQILMWHEIVNDTVGDLPLVITFCPLCNTAIAFERTFDGAVRAFGTTGRLRYSNLIMYDDLSETWWQQATGEAVAGTYAGQFLKFYPAAIVAWSDFKRDYPDGSVMSRDTGFSRPYGNNPYVGYDNVNRPPFLYRGPPTPDTMPPTAHILTIDLNDDPVAYPLETLSEVRVVNDLVGGTDVVVFWVAGTASALHASTVAGGRDVGAANAFERTLNGVLLTFEAKGESIVDRETGSTWDVLGRAVSGKLAGEQLTPVVATNHFWFSWAAFRPHTRIYQP